MLFSRLSSSSCGHQLRLAVPWALALISLALLSTADAGDHANEGLSTREARQQAIQLVPFRQLNSATSNALREVLDNPSFYRRMPTQSIQCDPELFSFLVRRPEFMVSTWDLMGITRVTAKRTSPFSFLANDGAGTKCKCDLVYGDEHVHIYYSAGDYDGSMSPRNMRGRAVCIIRSDTKQTPESHSGHIVRGTMDVFLKLDNLGADLLTRTFGPLVAKTADQNFVETAQFVSQLSQVCAVNPSAAMGLAAQLDNIDEPVRQEFVSIATRIAEDKQLATISASSPEFTGNSSHVSQALQSLKEGSMITVPAQELAQANRTEQKFVSRLGNVPSSYAEPTGSASDQATAISSRKQSAAPNLPASENSRAAAGLQQPPTAIRPHKGSASLRR